MNSILLKEMIIQL